ncbi:hypothetical protein NPS01_43250 [Nocardioides psychrotolerans]|uniref:Uncharacterized protein n=1 Tax=Nocardioides psychrotolerans TaxID=1005945 RepID=A0A1I3EF03_9ACTN|nr:hypothetical protein [Nocardioides psychrotolerans]GEP40662.1 hypothetical protein NPS01_43250 [Nocardioides psychrotolerans]SFH97519.1 hypothetical protein SAMN05216561_103333 [Nocardioides psychrotolerans]
MGQFFTGVGMALLLTLLWFVGALAIGATNDDGVSLLVVGAVAISLSSALLVIGAGRRSLGLGMLLGGPLGLVAHAVLAMAALGE